MPQPAEIQIANLVQLLQKLIEMADKKQLKKLEDKYQEFLKYLGKYGISNLVMKVVETNTEKEILMQALLATDIRAIPSPTENAFLIAKADQEAFERLCNKVLFETRNKNVSVTSMLDYAVETEREVLKYEFSSIEDARQFIHKINATQSENKNFIVASDNLRESNVVYIMNPQNSQERAHIAIAAVKAELDMLDDNFDLERKLKCIKYEKALISDIQESLAQSKNFYLADGLNEEITKKNTIAIENGVISYFDKATNSMKYVPLSNNIQKDTAQISTILQKTGMRNTEILSDSYYQSYMVVGTKKERKAEIEQQQERILNALAENKELCGKNSSIKGYARPEFTEEFLKKELEKVIQNGSLSEQSKQDLNRVVSGSVRLTEQRKIIENIWNNEELTRKEIYILKIYLNKQERSIYDATIGYMIQAACRNINYEDLSVDEIESLIVSELGKLNVSNIANHIITNTDIECITKEYMQSNHAKEMVDAAIARTVNPRSFVNTKNVLNTKKELINNYKEFYQNSKRQNNKTSYIDINIEQSSASIDRY